MSVLYLPVQIHWVSEQGLNNRGSVEFSREGDGGLKTRVQMKISYEVPMVRQCRLNTSSA